MSPAGRAPALQIHRTCPTPANIDHEQFTLESRRGGADVDVRAGRLPRDGAAESDEGDSGGAQVLHEGRALGTVRQDGDVERLVVIEAEPVVQGRLTEGAHGQRAA